jgi:hypothetical protein
VEKSPARRAAIIWVPVGSILTLAGGLVAFIGVGRVLLGAITLTLLGSLYFLYRALHVLVAENPTTQEEVKQVEGRLRREMLREKRMLLKALAELELDHDMGKLSEKDYRDASANYRARIARIFRQLDAGADYDALVKEELARRKRQKPGTTATAEDPAPPPEPMPMPVPVPESTPATTRRTCPTCATSNDPDAAFCKKCGGALA